MILGCKNFQSVSKQFLKLRERKMGSKIKYRQTRLPRRNPVRENTVDNSGSYSDKKDRKEYKKKNWKNWSPGDNDSDPQGC
jgi:hypothetical protein